MPHNMIISRRGFVRLGLAAGGAAALGGAGALTLPAVAGERQWWAGGGEVSALAPFDQAMKTFMQERDVPAGQLAVTRRGKLVLARSYAWTDDADLRPEPTALFRIASLSKSITSVAINVLVQSGDLSATTPILDLLDFEPPSGQSRDSRVTEITVRQLLQHLGGWDRDASGDSTYADFDIAETLGISLPVSVDDILTYSAGLKLDHDPGTTHAYSNLGYMLLGKAIENVTGQSYQDFVLQNVLEPMDITRMRLGRSRKADAVPGEVPYFSQYTATTRLDDSGDTVPSPYGGYVHENRTSAGGWLASAVDLVRYAALYDSRKVLDADSIDRIFAEPENGTSDSYYYGMGWYVRPRSSGFNAWHTGALSGAYSMLVRTYHDMSWAVVFDQRDDPSGKSYGDIDPMLWDAASEVSSWPSHDLFDEYF